MLSVVKRYCKLQRSETRIKTKFYCGLEGIANREGISVIYHNSLKSLNTVLNKEYDKANAAVGKYVWSLKDDKFQEIHLLEENRETHSPWTFAHELGHYFSIQKHQDRSESAADRHILNLADKLLNDFEKQVLAIPLAVYSNTNDIFNVKSHVVNESKQFGVIYKKALCGYLIKRIKHFLKKINLVNS